MKALYIHGLHSSPNPDKLSILRDLNLEVIAPEIDYESEKGNVYPRIKALAIKSNVDIIIGSSMGGFIGFWLGKELGIPALLFNPALHFESMKEYIPKVDLTKKSSAYFCLGEKDQRVNPQEVRKYLASFDAHIHQHKIVMASWLAHGIDLLTFRSMNMWFLGELEQ